MTKYSNKILYQDDKILKFLIESPKYGNHEIIIDIEDWEKVKQYKWSIYFYKNKIANVCSQIPINKKYKKLLLHYLIFNDKNINHKNKNNLDYRKNNLMVEQKKGFNKIIYQDDKILKFLIESPKYGDFEVIVDAGDYNIIKNYTWYIHFSSTAKLFDNICSSLYIDGKTFIIRLHNLIMNDKYIDHKNGNICDNRKENLRKCTQSENMHNTNKPKNNTSSYKGVHWNKINKKWVAQICINYKIQYIGSFTNIIKAAEAYNKKAVELFGEFARLNIIKDEDI